MHHRVVVSLVLAAVFMSLTLPASYADTIIKWTFTGPNDRGTFGNVRTYTSEGITITATAWGYTTAYPPGSALESAALGQWGTGLGVCDRLEGLSTCVHPGHQGDNIGP